MAHRFDRRRLAFESLESRAMLAGLCGTPDTTVDGDAPSFDMEAKPAADVAREPELTGAIETPDVFALPIDETWFSDETWFGDETWWMDETWFSDETAVDAQEIEVRFETLCRFDPAPDAAVADWLIEVPADGELEPMCVTAYGADAEREVELPEPGADDGRQLAFAALADDLPAPTARGPSPAATRYQLAAAFGFGIPAADGDAFRPGFGGGPAKRRTR